MNHSAPDRVPPPVALRDRFWSAATRAQRVVIALGAVAGALVSIAGAVAIVNRLLDDDGAERISIEVPAEVVRIESQSTEADQFIQDLIDHDGTIIALNHQLMGKPGPGDVTIEYACDATHGCSSVRIQDEKVTFGEIAGGVWYKGCYGVVVDGVGYGVQGLDLEMTFRGALCPS